MVKRKIEPEQIAYLFHPQYKEIIAQLKAKGVTHIGGRPIADIVRPPHDKSIKTPGSDEFLNLGVKNFTGPTYGSLGGQIGAAAPAGAVA
jgi:hypothetical protein